MHESYRGAGSIHSSAGLPPLKARNYDAIATETVAVQTLHGSKSTPAFSPGTRGSRHRGSQSNSVTSLVITSCNTMRMAGGR